MNTSDRSNQFPTISNVRIHQWPDRSIVFGTLRPEDKKWVFEAGSYTEANESAVKILEHCDGTRSTTQIAIEIAHELGVDANIITKKLTEFLEKANKQHNHILFLEKPIDRPQFPERTGSKAHFTPIHFVLELTSRCNMACKHCYRAYGTQKPADLGYSKIVDVIDQMHAVGARALEITGGEFTLHPKALDVIGYAAQRMELVALLTNGYLVTEDFVERLSEYKHKLLWSVSLDSFDAKYHDSFRGLDGSHRKVCNAVKALSKNGHQVKVAMSVTDGNIAHARQTMDFAHDELGASFFGFSQVLPFGRASETLVGLSPQNAVQFEELYEHAKRHGEYLAAFPREQMEALQRRNVNCGAGWRAMTVGPNGKVRPCVMVDERQICLGDINQESILEISRKPIVQRMRTIPAPLKEYCEHCESETFCKYCIYRGLVRNAERVKNGLEGCAWAKRFNLESILASPDKSKGSCGSKSCRP
jgi:radical SAM protein with 4Fe4S-binding SPASM domain